MRIALLADIHANLPALEACLDAAGLLGAAGLLTLYLVIISIAQGAQHAVEHHVCRPAAIVHRDLLLPRRQVRLDDPHRRRRHRPQAVTRGNRRLRRAVSVASVPNRRTTVPRLRADEPDAERVAVGGEGARGEGKVGGQGGAHGRTLRLAGLGDWYDYGHGQPMGPARFTSPQRWRPSSAAAGSSTRPIAATSVAAVNRISTRNSEPAQ